MKNAFLQNVIQAYRTRDIEGFEALTTDYENIQFLSKTVQRQIRNMTEGIKNPLPEPNTIIDPINTTLKAASRVFRRRFASNRHTTNGAFLQDKRANVEHPNRDAMREYNFMHHATKGYRLRSRYMTKQEQVQRDAGYSALILPDLSDKEAMDAVRETYVSAPRLAVTKNNYLNRNGNIPGSVRRAGAVS